MNTTEILKDMEKSERLAELLYEVVYDFSREEDISIIGAVTALRQLANHYMDLARR